MRRRALVALLTTTVLLLPSAALADGEVFRFRDPDILESSALIDFGDLMVTVNDSGSFPDVYVINPSTGRTVGSTLLDVAPVDIEALAPVPSRGGQPQVWVGDIGDNARQRRFVKVYLAPIAQLRLDIRPKRYNLVYPDGPHDAESMFTDASGRLYLITKGFTGGGVYRVPARMYEGVGNRLERVGSVRDYATDAAMLNDGAHVLVRSYGIAAVYTFPGFQRLGSFRLPPQRQGEGVSVGPDGRIRLSSEGARTPVLEVSLPADLQAAIAGESPTPSATPTASTSPAPSASPTATPSASPAPAPTEASGPLREDAGRTTTGGVALGWAAGLVILAGAVVIGVGLRRRRT